MALLNSIRDVGSSVDSVIKEVEDYFKKIKGGDVSVEDLQVELEEVSRISVEVSLQALKLRKLLDSVQEEFRNAGMPSSLTQMVLNFKDDVRGYLYTLTQLTGSLQERSKSLRFLLSDK